MNKTNNTTWILQKLEQSSETRQALLRACSLIECPVIEVPVVAYADTLPDLPEINPPFIFYRYAKIL